MKIIPSSVKGCQDLSVSLKLDEADRIELIRLEGKLIKIVEDRDHAEVQEEATVFAKNLMHDLDAVMTRVRAWAEEIDTDIVTVDVESPACHGCTRKEEFQESIKDKITEMAKEVLDEIHTE
jgi:gas vesicle protein